MNNAYSIQNKRSKSLTLIQIVQALSEMLYVFILGSTCVSSRVLWIKAIKTKSIQLKENKYKHTKKCEGICSNSSS